MLGCGVDICYPAGHELLLRKIAETGAVVRRVLARRGDTTLEGEEQLWPHRDRTDAMYAATLRRDA